MTAVMVECPKCKYQAFRLFFIENQLCRYCKRANLEKIAEEIVEEKK